MATHAMGRLARDESVDRRRYTWRWWRLGAVALVAGAGFFALEPVDVAIGRWGARLGQVSHDGFADQVIEGFKNFAQPLTLVIAITLVALFDNRRKGIIIALLVAQIGALATYNAGKLTIARDRPYIALERAADSAEADLPTWRGWRPGNTGHGYQSFPSGHSAAAFALGVVLAWYYPRARALFWILAVGCAASRVLVSAHWPSDCIVGAGIGYLWAQIALRVAR